MSSGKPSVMVLSCYFDETAVQGATGDNVVTTQVQRQD
jgi:hypothetical protein